MAIALLLSCFVFGFSAKAAVYAGAGNGTSFKVTSVKELGPVLDFINASSHNETGESSQSKHTSATLDIQTKVTYEMHKKLDMNEVGVSHQSQRVDRTLKMYITEDVTYYESKGTMSSSITARTFKEGVTSNFVHPKLTENKTKYVDFSFDMKILRYDNTAYLYFKQFVYSDSTESRSIKPENTHRWIEVPTSIAEAFVLVDNINRDTLSELEGVIEYFLKEGKIASDDKILRADALDIYGSEEIGISLDYKIDCSSPKTPNLSTEMSEVSSEEEYKDNYSISERITINNIDNTEVKFNEKRIEISAKTEQEWDELFIIDKKGDENE